MVSNATFDGANILNGSVPQIKFIANAQANSFITLSTQNLSLGGAIITIPSTASLGTITFATQVLASLTTSISQTNGALGNLGSQSKQIANHASFVSKLTDQLTAGVGNLVDADLANGKCAAAGPAGPAATRHPGVVDRQPGAAGDPVVLQGRLAS